ncbi:MAG: BlaI/MecI/CopY family transcriptional regulator [Candidatus Micrarchaeia archaeon]
MPGPEQELGKTEFEQVSGEFKEFREQMKNPLVVGAMLHKLSEERSSANLVLREINAKLDRLLALEGRLSALESAFAAASEKPGEAKALLSETDEAIMQLVKKQGKACAEDVQKRFKYKGANAACSRLNRLFQQGLLEKKQAGKKVFYLPKTAAN